MKHTASLLITDLDDTIWYWFKMWHASFSAMLAELKRVTELPDQILIPQIKTVHERHHTSEYAFLLQELPCLQERYGEAFDPLVALPTVVETFRRVRKENLQLYPTVLDTLVAIRAQGARIIAFTESQRYYSIQRLKHCGLDGIVDKLYATAESENVTSEQILKSRKYDEPIYTLQSTEAVTLPLGLKKPNPEVLQDILRDEHCSPDAAVYVGDTLSKDVAMANQAGVLSAHAKYGETHRKEGYELLVAVTHWTAEDVRRQAKATTASLTPGAVLDVNFAQLLDHVSFGPAQL